MSNVCPQCQATVREGQLYCSRCGTPLTARGAAPPPPVESAASRLSASLQEFVGRTLDGKYKLQRLLGAGGMGAVFMARRIHIGDDVAVKLLHPHYVHEPSAIERFRREAQAAARLRHPNIVAIYDFAEGHAAEPAYIVMELVNGISLRALLQKERRLQPQRAIKLMHEICAGVGQAHRHNVIHRDIKPDNVIVVPPDQFFLNDDTEKVKVLDFGIAKLRDMSPEQTLTQTGAVMGTPYYMSPEQCRGDALDARSDVYSLSAMLYEMLTGAPPFTAQTITGVVAKHLTEAPAPLRTHLENISPSLEAVVLRALAKDARLRQGDAHVFARELQQALQTPQPRHEIDEIVARTLSGAPSLGPDSPMPPVKPDKVSFDQPTRGVRAGAAAAAVALAAEGQDGMAEARRLNRKLIFGASVVVAVAVFAAGAGAWLVREQLSAALLAQPTPAPVELASPSPTATPDAGTITATTDPADAANAISPAIEVTRIESAESLIVNGELVTEKDLAGLSASELRLLRNAVFARHGRVFDTPGLQKFYASRAWYKENAAYSDELLTTIDRDNLKMMIDAEAQARAAQTLGIQSSSKNGDKFAPAQARDERYDTAWIEGAASSGVGEWIAFTFRPTAIQTIEIYPGFGKTPDAFQAYARVKRATLIFSDGTRVPLELFDEMRLQTVRLSAPVKTSSLRLIIEEVYAGAQNEDTAIAEINWR
ncbi:MAG: protein kinase [Acidobacteria bacterium]|nr:protein kinase [Acidobacteriota bacterium]